ncbi:hypothetical protein J2W28_006956 [Variovorax boronicumulans]|uniref:type I restriction endonuclease subunit M n=1 Tax=Variovorax boronicumulans TaxID=436515 RepID=UPI00277F4673|nr:type I restriction endonuclease subunit M [Variovorax boronicumulans]MDP9996465.1 hypothetical protein [Variovorax boronicumulans]MDQ0007777.1 hypothetical protein [Variovorax boronicumulans]
MCDLLKPETKFKTKRCTSAAPCNSEPRFRLGRTVATPAALALLEKHGVSPSTLLARHQCGDWGDVGADDASSNDNALKNGDRVLSVYRLLDLAALQSMTSDERRRSPRVWIITERDFSVTTVLTPEDY